MRNLRRLSPTSADQRLTDVGQLTVRLPAPHSARSRVTEEARRFNVLACGRRFGKTTLSIDRMAQPALHGAPCAWFAPTFKMLADAWQKAVRIGGHPVEHTEDAAMRVEPVASSLPARRD